MFKLKDPLIIPKKPEQIIQPKIIKNQIPEVSQRRLMDLPPPPKPVIRIEPKSVIEENIQLKNNEYVFIVNPEIIDEKSNKVLEMLETSIDSIEKMKSFNTILSKTAKNLNVKEREIDKEKIKTLLIKNMFGLGKIELLMEDPKIKGVYCDGLNLSVVIEHIDYGMIKTNLVFVDSLELNRLIKNIATYGDASISDANPAVRGIMKTGEKFNLTLGSSFLNAKFSIVR